MQNETKYIYVNKVNNDEYISNYDYLLNYLESVLQVDKKIIHNLLEINEMYTVLIGIKIVRSTEYDLYVISDNCSFKSNYEKEKSYILANYLLIDNNFEIKKDYEGTYNQENYLFCKKNRFHMSIKENKEFNTLELLIQLENDLLIPYDIDILNEDEKYKLKYTIMLQKSDLYEGLIKKDGNSYASFLIQIIKEKKLIENIKSMHSQINSIYSDFETKFNKYTEDNKLFFQRALTEIQLRNF